MDTDRQNCTGPENNYFLPRYAKTDIWLEHSDRYYDWYSIQNPHGHWQIWNDAFLNFVLLYCDDHWTWISNLRTEKGLKNKDYSNKNHQQEEKNHAPKR